MAKTPLLLIALLLVFNLFISTVMAVRDIPDKNLKKPSNDVKHPDMFFNHDRGYLIPGLGRGIKPKSKKGFNPFTYNPITGSNNGIPGLTIPSIGGIGGGSNNGIPGLTIPSIGGVGGGSYVPGGDDTLVPNPGVEVPNPGGSGSPPAVARP